MYEPTMPHFIEWLSLRNKPIPVGGGLISPPDLLASTDETLFNAVFERWKARQKGETPLEA